MSTININTTLNDLETNASNNVAYFYFQLADISIKVDPKAFLSTMVVVNGGEVNLEDVAKLYQVDDYTAAVAPDDKKNMVALIKALKISHPEFDLEQSSIEADGETTHYLLCHMADVNDDRYKIYIDSINTRYDATMTKLQVEIDKTRAKLAKDLVGASAELLQTVEDRIADVEDYCKTGCETSRQEKFAEIEAGHKRYLDSQVEKQQRSSEQQQSRDASLSISME